MNRQYCVISHTHWDREWYLPFEQFRLKLTALMDNLIDLLECEKEYVFHLDAQTVVLEDYLEIKPEMKPRLTSLISQGRLLVGPWYVQNDFFLVSGEATVRNLLIGSRIAEEYGKCMMVGYAPDQFGLISQLPQILNGFGLDSCLFGRGKEHYTEDAEGNLQKSYEKTEFLWNGKDGSSVLGIFMPYWYNNAQRFSKDITKSSYLLNQIKDQLDVTSTTPYYLLMNGVDHLEAQEDLLPILNRLNEMLPNGEAILQTSLPEYIRKVRDFLSESDIPQYTGEMRCGEDRNLLQGTLSTRVHLKQRNAYCQMLLENQVEPLYTWLQLCGLGDFPHGQLNYLWKLLIRNHAHDSICGCHIDAVSAHMEDRFNRVEEAASYLLRSAMEAISLHIDRSRLQDSHFLLSFFNTISVERTEVVDIELEFVESLHVDEFTILDGSGNPVPYKVLSRKKATVRRLSPINLPGVVAVDRYKIRMLVEDIAQQSYKTYMVRLGANGVTRDIRPLQECQGYTMENEFLLVLINMDGSIDITHKKTGMKYAGGLLLEDREDVGDSYLYQRSETGYTQLSANSKPDIQLVSCDWFSTEYVMEYNMELPAYYDFQNECRSVEKATNHIRTCLRLDRNCPYLKIDITVDNIARDHRMRVIFPTYKETTESLSGAPFAIVHRERSTHKGINKSAEQPFAGFTAVEEGGSVIAFFSRGLFEYEHLSQPANPIAITLFRGNESIYRPDGQVGSEEAFVIPGNQCQGRNTYQLAVLPYTSDLYDDGILYNLQEFSAPLLNICLPVDKSMMSVGSPFVQDAAISEIFTREDQHQCLTLPRDNQFFKVDGKDIILSALMIIENRKSVLLRFYNSSNECRLAHLEMFIKVKEAYVSALNEKRGCSLEVAGNLIGDLAFKPNEIKTIEIVFN